MVHLKCKDNTAAKSHCIFFLKSLKRGGPRWLGLKDEALRKVFRSLAKPAHAQYPGLIIKDTLLRWETDTDRLRIFRRDTCSTEPAAARNLLTGTEVDFRKFATDWVGCWRSSRTAMQKLRLSSRLLELKEWSGSQVSWSTTPLLMLTWVVKFTYSAWFWMLQLNVFKPVMQQNALLHADTSCIDWKRPSRRRHDRTQEINAQANVRRL